MSQRPLAIAGLGMISCLGEGAEVNASAMRCGYDGFQQTMLNQPFSETQKQIGAVVDSDLWGIDKFSYMSKTVIDEATKEYQKSMRT